MATGKEIVRRRANGEDVRVRWLTNGDDRKSMECVGLVTSFGKSGGVEYIGVQCEDGVKRFVRPRYVSLVSANKIA